MTSLYDIFVPQMTNLVKAQQTILAKTESFAAEKGIPMSEMLQARLADDMWPLSKQVCIVTIFAKAGAASLGDESVDQMEPKDLSLEECKAALSGALDLLAKVSAEPVNKKQGTTITTRVGMNVAPIKANDYAGSFLLPNGSFHTVTMYNIARMKGVPLGKMDFLGSFMEGKM
ncbi:hypothetical protein F5Y15DRAFT_110262 [Xylariaceae sp. FL0016]|nr:hypothetical protein F5Y15DRAFT_110262 [Xylariaceae sp. FL0016]